MTYYKFIESLGMPTGKGDLETGLASGHLEREKDFKRLERPKAFLQDEDLRVDAKIDGEADLTGQELRIAMSGNGIELHDASGNVLSRSSDYRVFREVRPGLTSLVTELFAIGELEMDHRVKESNGHEWEITHSEVIDVDFVSSEVSGTIRTWTIQPSS